MRWCTKNDKYQVWSHIQKDSRTRENVHKRNDGMTKSLDCHCPMGNAHARIYAWETGTGVPTRASENKFFSTNGLPAQFK